MNLEIRSYILVVMALGTYEDTRENFRQSLSHILPIARIYVDDN